MESTNGSVDILYIEDDEVDIQNVLREFKKVNTMLNIDTAHDGVQALDKLYGRNGEKKLDPSPKVILLDMNLPKMNGLEFLRTLRADPKFVTINVYVLTAAWNTQDKLAMHDLSLAGCIVKPLQYTDALNLFWTIFNK